MIVRKIINSSTISILYIDSDKKYTAGPGTAYWRSNAYVRVTTKAGSTFILYAWD
ncbi:hypothetical protein TPDSL_15950 [Terrisporobacter petrolearius]